LSPSRAASRGGTSRAPMSPSVPRSRQGLNRWNRPRVFLGVKPPGSFRDRRLGFWPCSPSGTPRADLGDGTQEKTGRGGPVPLAMKPLHYCTDTMNQSARHRLLSRVGEKTVPPGPPLWNSDFVFPTIERSESFQQKPMCPEVSNTAESHESNSSSARSRIDAPLRISPRSGERAGDEGTFLFPAMPHGHVILWRCLRRRDQLLLSGLRHSFAPFFPGFFVELLEMATARSGPLNTSPIYSSIATARDTHRFPSLSRERCKAPCP